MIHREYPPSSESGNFTSICGVIATGFCPRKIVNPQVHTGTQDAWMAKDKAKEKQQSSFDLILYHEKSL